VLKEGIAEETDKDKGNFIIGIDAIKEKYGEELFKTIDPKSDLSYEDKLYIFDDYLENDDIGDWKPYKIEQHFELEYEDKILLNGYIDRIDINSDGDLRVVDYKSSNKVFRDADLKTPLQMVIYALACEKLFGKIPIEFQYDMILLGEKQDACSSGYFNRGVKKINKILDEIEWSESTKDWIPKPTPLCFWCNFCENNPNADWYTNGLCEYYSLWTPDNKTFAKNKDYN
jgi:putative RecB family exonuclease